MKAFDAPSAPRFSTSEIRSKVAALGQWFHNMELGGVQTAPDHFLGDYPEIKWRRFSQSIPSDLTGKTVLDIGCNAGFYSIQMKRRGAERVVGTDSDQIYLDQAKFAAEVNGLDIEFRKMSVYEVADLGEQFDIVLFMGVFYHLRHPLLALDLIYKYAAKDILVFQSMLRGCDTAEDLAPDYPFSETEIFNQPGFPLMYFIENRYTGDPSNWWISNKPGIEALLRSSGFEITDNPEEEVFICKKLENRGWIDNEVSLLDELSKVGK